MNLLPPQEQKRVLVNYRIRLMVAVVGALTILVLIAGVLLLPAYVIATNKVAIAQRQLDQATKNGGSGVGAEDPKETVRKIEATLASVSPADTQGVPSQVVKELLGRITPGISVKDIFFTVSSGGGSLTVHGVARDRKALALFGESLRTDPLFANAEIPPSSFVKKTNIDFSITVDLATGGEKKKTEQVEKSS